MKLISPFEIVDDTKEVESALYDLHRERNIQRKPLVNVSIADIHFGALDPEYHYKILTEQFTNVISNIYFDTIEIKGDLFHHKFMSNSDVILYAMKFIDDICNICKMRPNNPTIILLAGTLSHDANQLKLFYHYITDNSVDIRIVEHTRFEYIHGAKILCIPEEYGKSEEYYNQFFFNSGYYDGVIMHGMLEGAIPVIGKQESGEHSERAPIFNINHFVQCTGYISAGHVHTPMCLNRYMYYSGSPLRWQFGEEEQKGFHIFLHNLDQGTHHCEFIPIISRSYVTHEIDYLLAENPNRAIQRIKSYYESNDIDFLRLKVMSIAGETETANLELIKKYFKNNNKIKIHINRKAIQHNNTNNSEDEINKEMEEYSFLFDTSLTPEEKLISYINYKKGYEYITIDVYRDLLN